MKIIMFSSQPYDHEFFDLLNNDSQHDIHYLPEHLNSKTAQLAKGYPAVCCFVNDHLDADVSLPELYQRADIISLHCPLTPDTHHLINQQALNQMKPGVMIINTSRGAVLDTKAIIGALKTMHIGYLGIDVYEEEGDLFFEDLSNQVIDDDTFTRLLTFPNVLITGHQGFFTKKAVHNIAEITLQNITAFETGKGEIHTVNP